MMKVVIGGVATVPTGETVVVTALARAGAPGIGSTLRNGARLRMSPRILRFMIAFMIWITSSSVWTFPKTGSQ